MKSLGNSSFKKSTDEEIKYRQSILGQIIEEAKNRGDVINENYLLYHMNLGGIENYTRSRLYQDQLTFDSENNYIRHFLPRYSRFQEDIITELDAIKDEAVELGSMDWSIKKTITRETKDGEFGTEIT